MAEYADVVNAAREEIIALHLVAAQQMRSEAVFRAAIAHQEYVNARLRGKQEEIKLQHLRNWNRPSVFFGADISQEERTGGTVWIASARGASAEGNSPETACLAFDELWTQGANDE